MAKTNAGRHELYRVDSDDTGKLRGTKVQRQSNNSSGQKRHLKKAKKTRAFEDREMDLVGGKMQDLFERAEFDFMMRFSLSMSMPVSLKMTMI